MAFTARAQPYDELLEYLIEQATPEQILAFKLSEAAKAYAQELVERHKEGTLTPEERLELDEMLRFEGKMSVLKAKALAALHSP
jgi:hypothetical protein